MSIAGIHGHLLEVTVVSCTNLKDKEWISRQDPYVCVEYAASKFRTRTCTDGGKNPVFQEKFTITLIEGLRELQVAVWNSNTINRDDFIGNGRVLLDKVLREGYDDSPWALQSQSGRHHGEVRLTLHYPNAKKSVYPSFSAVPSHITPTAPPNPYGAAPNPYAAPPPPPPPAAYPAAPAYHGYSPNMAHPASSPYPFSSTYPPSSVYPPPVYPPHTSQPYPPPPSGYPAPPHQPNSQYPPPSDPYAGAYPRPY